SSEAKRLHAQRAAGAPARTASASWIDERGAAQAAGQQRPTLRRKAHDQLRFLSFVRGTDRFHLPLSRSAPCRMAGRQTCVIAYPDGPGHFLATHSSGHRTDPAPSRVTITIPEESMSATWQWPKLK